MSPFGAFFSDLDRFARVCAALAFAPLFLLWAFTFAFVVPRLDRLDYLRLHYTALRGVDWVADWRMIFVFPVFGALAWLVNLVLAARLARTSRYLARLVMATTVVIELFVAIGGTFAVLLNG